MRLRHSERNRIRRCWRRLMNLSLYILGRLPDGQQVEGRLCWILFHADMQAFRDLGSPITGVTWIKTAEGPRPLLLEPEYRQVA